jgi:outer membrane lipase/esterase
MIPTRLTSFVRATARTLTAAAAFSAVTVLAGDPFSKIVTFGDSLSDTGNAYRLTGGAYPMSPPNAPGRIGNGPIWIEHLAESLGMTLSAEDQYAVAGARTDTGNFNVLFGLVVLANTGLQSQVGAYLAEVGPGGADPDALHTVWIGPNDIFTTLRFGGNMQVTVYQAVQNTAQAVAALGSNGARHILVANLPDLGLTPFGLAQGPIGSAFLSQLTDAYNGALSQALNGLAAAGIPTVRLDTAGLIREISEDPAAFDLVNTTGQAVVSDGDDDDFLFWNEVHPTTVGHRAIAQRAAEALVAAYSPRRGKGFGPGTVRSLNGLLGAAGR